MSPIISAAELHAALASTLVLDARAALGDRSASRAAFAEAHIPGAQHVDLEVDLSAPGPGDGRHPWPDDAHFARVLSGVGWEPGRPVVVYDDAQGALAAARLWFMLRLWGAPDVRVLDGGLAAWRAAGLPVSDAPVEPAATAVQGAFDRTRLVDSAALQRHVEAGGRVLDVRAAPRYRGEVEPLDAVAGHVPGAVNVPYADALADGRFRTPGALRDLFGRAMGDTPPTDWVVMCGSGVTACHTLLALERAGLPGARLATGSWSGWISDPARPVARG